MRAIKKSTKVVGRLVGFSSLALVLAVSNMASLLPKSLAAASGETITGDSSATSLVGAATNVGNLHITATGNPSEAVRLFVSHGSLAMTTITGLTFTGASSGATLEFSGTLSDVNTALATLQYTRNDLGSDTLEITLTGPGEVYDPATGHIYEYVYAQNPSGIDWPDSKAAADAMSTHGLTGYLATMTSSAENDYIAARLPDAGWMGASDAANEGDWKWVDGPETGMSFYSGVSDLNAGTTGVPVNGAYNDWNAGEPNDASGNEDCGQFLSGSSGQWNDLPCDNTALLAGYVVEFGEPGHLANIAYKNVALSTTGNTVSASSCPELQALDDNPGSEYDTINLTADIDCSGYQVDPLFINGFYGTFDGHGHTISHITIDNPNDSEIGLISNTNGAIIKDLTLLGGSVTGDDDVGGLIGYAYNTSIENVSSNLSVHASSGYGGGLVGDYDTEQTDSHISGSSVTGSIDGSYELGGLIGHYYQYGGSMTIEQTYTSSTITSTGSESGGLIGYAYVDEDGGPTAFTIQDVYTRGDIDGTGNSEQAGLIGGLSANNTGATTITIQRAYTSGHITGDNHVAGFLGYNGVGVNSNLAFVFKNNFTATSLTSNDSASTGAMIGEDDTASQVIDDSGNYFGETTSGLNAVCTGGQSTPLSDCTAIDTSVQPDYFRDNHSNQPMNTWDFSHIWHANAGDYPTFQPSVTSNDDNDGIPSAIEAAAPNDGDANGDGTADDQQANVASFVDTQTGKYAVLAVPSACSVSAASTVAETANSVHDSGFNYPAGLMNFSLNCGTSGYSATITQYYYGVFDSNYVVRKYDPNTHAYYTIPGASYSQTTIGGQVVTKVSYQVTDGSSLDTDGTANGTIVDPSGLGVAVVGVPNTGLGGRYR